MLKYQRSGRSHLPVYDIKKTCNQDVRNGHKINYPIINTLRHGVFPSALQYGTAHSALCTAKQGC